MNQISVYQTLENRNNPQEVLQNGPFLGNKKIAWLGIGYYFWESFVNNAHWWGDNFYKKNGYIICESSYIKEQDSCFDLYDNHEHLAILKSTIELLSKKGLYIKDKTTVARIIEYLRNIDSFPYKATRAKGEGVRSRLSSFGDTLSFQEGLPAYLELSPPIQVCFYDTSLLAMSQYRIIYPDLYRDDYLV